MFLTFLITLLGTAESHIANIEGIEKESSGLQGLATKVPPGLPHRRPSLMIKWFQMQTLQMLAHHLLESSAYLLSKRKTNWLRDVEISSWYYILVRFDRYFYSPNIQTP